MLLGVPQSDRTALVDLLDHRIENDAGEVISHNTLRGIGA